MLSRTRCHAIALLLISTAVFLLVSCTNVEKEYYPDGTLKSVVTYRGDSPDGPATWYYPNGNKELECTYINGQLEGKVTRWYYNGQYNREDYFRKGKKNGACIQWDETGFKAILQTYRNDTLHGPYVEWHPNGEILTEGRFYQGLYDSIWNYYDTRGIPVGKGIFSKGTGSLTGYYLNGKASRMVSYKNNQKHGSECWYRESGEVVREILYKDGRIVRIVRGDTASVASGSKSSASTQSPSL